MKDIKSLVENQKFDEVIELCKNSKETIDKYYLICAYVGKNQLNEALDVIEKNQDELDKWNQIATMKVHYVILKEIGDIKRSQNALEHYENLPYVNQECEEFLRYWPLHINANDRPKYKEYDVDEISSIFESEINEDKLLNLFNYIDDYNDPRILAAMKKFFKRTEISRNLKVVGLFELLNNNIDADIEFPFEDGLKNYNLNELRQSGFQNNVNLIAAQISKLASKESNIKTQAVELLIKYAILFVPEDLSGDISLYAQAFISLTKEALGQKDKASKEVSEYKNLIKNKLTK